MKHPEPAHVLLQHQGFLRALARRLVTPDEADDLVQETWLRALQRPPRPTGSLREWLRKVAQNFAASKRRSAGSRASRERERAAPETASPVDEERARAELLRSVLDAVLALDEPYQATLLARYFRGQSAAAIAAQTHTPLATVRSRERRALAKLRERLDRTCGGDRLAWAGLLLRWVERPSRLAITALQALGLAGAAGVVGLLALQWVRSLETLRPARTPETVSRSPLRQREAVALGAAKDSRAEAATPASGGASEAFPQARVARIGEVRGRILLGPGRPAVGQVVSFSTGPEAESLPAQDEATTTDSDGRFSFRHEVEGLTRSRVSVRREGFVEELFAWTTAEAGLSVDLGDIALTVGGRIVGTVVDEEGLPVRGAALEILTDVTVDERARFSWRGLRARAAVQPDTGRFELNDVPAGQAQLTVHEIDGWRVSPPITLAAVHPNATTEARVVWSAPDRPAHGEEIALLLFPRPISSVWPDPRHVRLSTLATVEALGPQLVFRDLPEGPFTIEIGDPRFLPWRQTDVQAGQHVRAELRGNSGVVLDVRDTNGVALTGYAVEAVRQGPNRPNRFTLHSGPDPLPEGRLDGFVAGDYRLDVLLPDLGTRAVDVPRLAAGETRTVPVTFAPATVLSGRIRYAGGRPAEVEVLLLEPAVARDSAASPVVRLGGAVSGSTSAHRHEIATTWTDASGAFHFEPLQPGRYAVQARDGTLEVASPTLEVGDDPPRRPVELTLPAGGTLVASLHGLGAGDEVEIVLVPVRESLPTAQRGIDHSVVAAEGVAVDGVARIGPLPAGEYQVELGLPRRFLQGKMTLDGRVLGRVPLGTVFLVNGRPTVVEFEVPHLALGAVSIQVKESGAPGAGLNVRLIPAGGEPYEGACSITDVDGRVTLPAFPGDYSLRIWRDGLPAASWKIQAKSSRLSVTPGGNTHLDVDFTAGRN